MGVEAYNFIRFLHDSGITIWQTLPLGIPHGDCSPYQCMSAHAGNPALISLDWLVEKGWLKTEDLDVDYGADKSPLIRKAFNVFSQDATRVDQQAFKNFCKEKAFWLDEFVLFYALRNEFAHDCWNLWPAKLKNKEAKTVKRTRQRLAGRLEAIKFEQFVFFQQWSQLKQFANEQGVLLFGDIPIFVSFDSADVWANRDVFKLDEDGNMEVVAGVPPDYFSETGQRWGNPHYDWEYLKKTKFKWWLDRIKTQDEMFDIVRIDHFRGLESAWEIPADEETAMNGKWVLAPGQALLATIQKNYPALALVAEDLGIITDDVTALRDEFALPGMKILHFAFGDDAGNPYLPHNCSENSVMYTGTHDNDTTLGWFHGLNDHDKFRVYEYLGFSQTEMPYTLIGTCFASVANLSIVPMQDVLCLGGDCRMNTPGTTEGNWNWRFDWAQLTDEYAGRLKHLVYMFGRN